MFLIIITIIIQLRVFRIRIVLKVKPLKILLVSIVLSRVVKEEKLTVEIKKVLKNILKKLS